MRRADKSCSAQANSSQRYNLSYGPMSFRALLKQTKKASAHTITALRKAEFSPRFGLNLEKPNPKSQQLDFLYFVCVVWQSDFLVKTQSHISQSHFDQIRMRQHCQMLPSPFFFNDLLLCFGSVVCLLPGLY